MSKEKLELLAKKKQAILEKKENLSKLEKAIRIKEKQKEKQSDLKKFIEIGKLANKVSIDQLDPVVLLGAFLEIAEQSSAKIKVADWHRKGSNFQLPSAEHTSIALCLSFKSPLDQKSKEYLKELGFKWNKFRKEFYGYGDKGQLVERFKEYECKIESVD